MTEAIETIEIHTSCGAVFSERIVDLDDWQLEGLIAQNPDRSVTPHLRNELARRRGALAA